MGLRKMIVTDTFLILTALIYIKIVRLKGVKMKTPMDLVLEAKQKIPEVSVDELKGKLDRDDNLVLIDVREGEEFSQGCIPSAIHMSRGTLEFQIGSQVPNQDQEIVLYCAAGARSLLAAQSLEKMGYKSLFSVEGGFRQWLDEGYEVASVEY